MFQYGPLSEIMLRVEHRHADGTWSTMEPKREPHDPAELDPEEDWQHGHVYICKACQEEIRIEAEEREESTTAG
jgi:hypothetical protein